MHAKLGIAGDFVCAVLGSKACNVQMDFLGASTANGLLKVLCDIPNGGSWLSALADWRLPVLLLTPGDSDGGVSGAAAAWVALCRELGVPLLGVVQLRGPWLSQARRRDGLPWCGWIPEHNHPQHQDGVTALAGLIRRGQLTASPKAAASSRV